MRSRIQAIGLPAILALVISSSACATRGYVRNQTEASAGELRTLIVANTEQIERNQQDVTTVQTESREEDQRQNEQIARTQEAVDTVRTETTSQIAEVKDLAETAQNSADSAEQISRTLDRRFADRGKLAVLETREIYFGFSSAAVQPEHAEAFQAVGDMLLSDPNAILVLEGRTDSTGDADFNRTLGQRRVDAATNYLVLELGVPIHRIYGFSYGEARPDYDNEVPTERQKNRSVKMVVLGPEAQTTIAALPR